jgi:hypothetical protein
MNLIMPVPDRKIDIGLAETVMIVRSARKKLR